MAASEASIDEQLELKKRARRRLVGATALALLAAIVLPMVMDHEPRPASQDIQVRIPSSDPGSGVVSRMLPAKPTATPLPPAAVAEAKPATEAASDAKPADKPEAKPELPKESSKPVAVPAAVPAAAKPADNKPADNQPVAAKPAEVKADKKADEKRAAEALSGKAADQWVVQLGAYKDVGNVKLLLSKLKGIGVPAYTEKFDSPAGPRTRVRAGPFASKEAADKARAKVKIIGVDGPVAAK